MHCTLIIAHPYPGSFSHVLADLVQKIRASQNKEVYVIDLYHDQFKPELSQSELRVYNQGQSLDPLVKTYQSMLTNSDELICVFPIWWYEAPAIFKGFIDKVMMPGFAFEETPLGLKGKLTHILKTSIITTSEVETNFMRNDAGNPIEQTLLKITFKVCGIESNLKWFNCEHIASGSLEQRQSFIKEIEEHFIYSL